MNKLVVLRHPVPAPTQTRPPLAVPRGGQPTLHRRPGAQREAATGTCCAQYYWVAGRAGGCARRRRPHTCQGICRSLSRPQASAQTLRPKLWSLQDLQSWYICRRGSPARAAPKIWGDAFACSCRTQTEPAQGHIPQPARAHIVDATFPVVPSGCCGGGSAPQGVRINPRLPPRARPALPRRRKAQREPDQGWRPRGVSGRAARTARLCS